MNTTPVNQPFHINPDGSVESGYSVPTGYPIVVFYPGIGEFFRMDDNTDWEHASKVDGQYTYINVTAVDEDGEPDSQEFTFRYVGSWGEPD